MNSTKPKFSVVIPVYNTESYLAECIDSLIHQPYENFEAICINDGSTDKSLQVLEDFAQKDGRIKVINQKNQGVSAARNAGIDAAVGDYIIFLDSDDFLAENCLYIFSQIIEKEKPDVIQYDLKVFGDTNSLKTSFDLMQQEIKVSKNPNYFENNPDIYFRLNTLHTCCVFKTDFVKSNNIYYCVGAAMGEDSLFFNEIFSCNPLVYICNKKLYYFRMRESSVTHEKNQYVKFMNHEMYEKNLRTFIIKNRDKSYMELFYKSLLDCYCRFWPGLYFSKNKESYLERFKNYLAFGEDLSYNVSKAKKHLIMAKYHLSWFYWKIIRPIGKYAVVYPYREFKYFVREFNAK